jgi:hypothetical protein
MDIYDSNVNIHIYSTTAVASLAHDFDDMLASVNTDDSHEFEEDTNAVLHIDGSEADGFCDDGDNDDTDIAQGKNVLLETGHNKFIIQERRLPLRAISSKLHHNTS